MLANGSVPRATYSRSNLCCPAIGVIQIERHNDNKLGFNRWSLDDDAISAPNRRPWYAFSTPNPPGRSRAFSFRDAPGFMPFPPTIQGLSFTQEFETCVVCTDGTLVTCILSCITWSHDFAARRGARNHLLTLDLDGVPVRGIPNQGNPNTPWLNLITGGHRESSIFRSIIAPWRQR